MKLPGSRDQLGSEAPFSVRFDHFTGSNTRRAYPRPFVGSIKNNANSLQIGIPSSFRDVMGMADIVSKERAFATNIAACCHRTPPISDNSKGESIPDAAYHVKFL